MTFPGPTPPQSNPPINPQYYQPKMFFIADIIRGTTTGVITTVPLDYVIGQQVRLLIPPTYGAQQLNNVEAFVIGLIGNNQVTLNIDSRRASGFIPNPTYGPTKPQIIAIGDNNTGSINPLGRQQSIVIPGSFINISPR